MPLVEAGDFLMATVTNHDRISRVSVTEQSMEGAVLLFMVIMEKICIF